MVCRCEGGGSAARPKADVTQSESASTSSAFPVNVDFLLRTVTELIFGVFPKKDQSLDVQMITEMSVSHVLEWMVILHLSLLVLCQSKRFTGQRMYKYDKKRKKVIVYICY